MRFPTETASIPRSRHWMAEVAERAGARPEAAATIALLTTEAVTNVIKHCPGCAEVELAAEYRSGRFHVEVSDDNDGKRPVLKNPSPTAQGGRGMMLIDHLAADWGVKQRGSGKAVWFDVPL